MVFPPYCPFPPNHLASFNLLLLLSLPPPPPSVPFGRGTSAASFSHLHFPPSPTDPRLTSRVWSNSCSSYFAGCAGVLEVRYAFLWESASWNLNVVPVVFCFYFSRISRKKGKTAPELVEYTFQSIDLFLLTPDHPRPRHPIPTNIACHFPTRE